MALGPIAAAALRDPGTMQLALAHPAVARLASVLEVDLSDATQRAAVIAAAAGRLEAAHGGAPADDALVIAGSGAGRVMTPYYVKEVLDAYRAAAQF